jgi:type II secretion system protein C
VGHHFVNRYQQEVAEMDRRHARLIRSLSFIGAAGLVALALWSAGLPPADWWEAARARWSDKDSDEPLGGAPDAATRPTVTASPSAALKQDGAGTQSSTSPRPLHLVGTTPGRNKQEGTARIGTNRDSPQTYVAGALLSNGSRIAEIHRDHVVLERDDKRVELYLDGLVAKARPADDMIMVGGPPRDVPTPPLTREVLTDYLRPSPVLDDDGVHGFQVYPGRKAGVFAQLGLQPGDVITSINDAPVVDTASALDALREITRGTSVVVNVERKGKAERLVLDSALITTDLEREQNSAAATPMHDLAGV